jgi:ATP-binding cassette subfamily F protein 3
VVGPNGAGKTTLLRLLAGHGGADDGGEIKRGTNLCEGYFDQHLGSLDPDKTAVEEVRSVRPDMNVDAARQYLSRFRFYGDDALRRVQGLSGGERSRLALAKLLLEPRNLLFLDEPTNHLDIPATEILEEALVGFEGTVVLVSHDRRFLERVSTRTVSVQGGHVDVYPGGFKAFCDHLAKLAAEAETASRPTKGASSPPRAAQAKGPGAAPRPAPREEPPARDGGRGRAPVARAEPAQPARPARAVRQSGSTMPAGGGGAEEDAAARRRAFEAEKAAARATERKRKRVKELEAEIASGEARLSAMREALKQDHGGDGRSWRRRWARSRCWRGSWTGR